MWLSFTFGRRTALFGERWLKELKEKRLVDAREISVSGFVEKFVGHIHKNPIITGRMFNESRFEFRGNQGRISGGIKKMVKTGGKLLGLGGFEVKTTTNSSKQRQEVGMAKAVQKTLVPGKNDTQKGVRVEVFGSKNS